MSTEDEEVLEATNSNEEENFEEEIEEDTDDIEALREALGKEKIAKQQILARAKKAEALLRENKDKPSLNNNNALTSETVETTILKAQGLPDDEIAYLKKLATLNGTSIIEAQSDDIFKSFKANKEAQEKQANAKLGASRGSGSVKKEKTFTTKGLSDEDHKEMWRQSQGR